MTPAPGQVEYDAERVLLEGDRVQRLDRKPVNRQVRNRVPGHSGPRDLRADAGDVAGWVPNPPARIPSVQTYSRSKRDTLIVSGAVLLDVYIRAQSFNARLSDARTNSK